MDLKQKKTKGRGFKTKQTPLNQEEHMSSTHPDKFSSCCNVFKSEEKEEERDGGCAECNILQPIVKLEEGEGSVITEIKVEVVGDDEEAREEEGGDKDKVRGATKCQHCNQWFDNKDSALIHRVTSHASPYCFPCDAVFEDVAEMENHVRATHREIRCDHCQKVFGEKLELAKHRASVHQMFACKFCDYQFHASALATHKAKTHRVESFTYPSSTQEYYTSTVHLFDPLLDVTKVKCCLCKKAITTSRLINHVKFFHNINNPTVIRGLRCSKIKFDFSTNNLTIVPRSNDGRLEDDPALTRPHDEGQKVEGEGSYQCLFCQEHFQDQGAHLLLKHGLLRCPTCPTFLPPSSLASHRASNHSATMLAQPLSSSSFSSMATFPSSALATTNLLTCSVCDKTLTSPLSLLTHRHAAHKLYTCILCEAIILTALKPFLKHMLQHHLITSANLTARLKTEETTPTFATASLARVDRNSQRLDNDCDDGDVDIYTDDDGLTKGWTVCCAMAPASKAPWLATLLCLISPTGTMSPIPPKTSSPCSTEQSSPTEPSRPLRLHAVILQCFSFQKLFLSFQKFQFKHLKLLPNLLLLLLFLSPFLLLFSKGLTLKDV